jgi:hypothetical protein
MPQVSYALRMMWALADLVVVSRLPNSKSTPTLLALSDAIGPVIPRLNEGFTPETARRTLVQLSALIEASWKWSQTTSDKGGEQKVCRSRSCRLSFIANQQDSTEQLALHGHHAPHAKYPRSSTRTMVHIHLPKVWGSARRTRLPRRGRTGSTIRHGKLMLPRSEVEI